VLRALVAVGVFAEAEDGRFELDEYAAALTNGAPGHTRDVVINFGEEMYRSFGELLHTVRTGESAFDAVFGQPLFDYYSTHPEAEASASARMTARSLPVTADLAASHLVDGITRVVDVGGGKGTVLTALLTAHPALRGVLYERQPVLDLARDYLATHHVLDRCELVAGDFFASVPAGGELYLLKSVLHDWDDDRCQTILANCRAAMSSDARLGIVEFVLPDRMTASRAHVPAALLDLIMMTYAGGRERTESDFRQLLATCGLRLEHVTALDAGPSLLTAVPD
jgi:hypothetical protein